MTSVASDDKVDSRLTQVTSWWVRHPSDWRVMALATVGFGTLYYLTERLGLLVQSQPENVPVFWPAAGLAAGTLVALGPQARLPVALPVALSSILPALIWNDQIISNFVFGICNVAECFIFASIMEHFDKSEKLASLRSVGYFLLAATVAAALAAAPAAITLKVLHMSDAPLLTEWRSWFESDGIGILTVAPVMLTLPSLRREPPTPAMLIESALALALTGAAAAFALSLKPGTTVWPIVTPVTALFSLFMWLAGRMPPAFSAIAAVMVPFVIVLTAESGIGRLGEVTLAPDNRIAAARIAILASSLWALTLTAMFARVRNDAEKLRMSDEHLRNALFAGHVYAFDHDVASGKVERSENAATILGVDSDEAQMGFQDYLQITHPQDRANILAGAARMTPAAPFTKSNVRIIRPDGQIVWLEQSETGIFDPNGKLARIRGLSQNVTERIGAEAAQGELVKELNHRVKNTLAIMSAIIELTRPGHDSLDDYVAALDGRISSMKKTHERLSQSNWMGVDLAVLVEDETAPYRLAGNIILDGPPLILPPTVGQSMSCALHELATNAAKHGALSRADGKLLVEWTLDIDQDRGRVLSLVWQEQTTLPAPAPTHNGYGMSIIRNQLRYEHQAKVDVQFRPEGLTCHIEVSIDGASNGGRI